MKIAQVSRYGQKLTIKELPIPHVQPDQLLIKMQYSPINPSDVYFIKGFYGIRKPLPTIGGFEGCGTIQDSKNKDLIGKKVMCWSHEGLNYGTWASHFICREKDIIILDNIDEGSFWKYSSPYINPFTVMGFLETAKEQKAKSVVFNAANSALGRMMIKLFKKENIKTICVVRKDEQIEELKALGAYFVINQNDEQFEKKIIQIMSQEETKIFYDAIGGGTTSSIIFRNIIVGGKMVVYGKFSNSRIQDLDPVDLVFKQKKIEGFWLSRWLDGKSDYFIENQIKSVVRDNIQGIFETKVQKIVRLEEINDVINQSLNSGGQGKFILDINI